jgi:tetratricopeptide (TPR) repeat protein
VLLLVAAVALINAVRLGESAGADGGELLARLRERTEQRIAGEREQVRSLVRDSRSADAAGAAAAALARLPDNSQLRLNLAAGYRARGEVAAALREYRRAVELVRDYADRRSPHFIGGEIAPWLRRVRPQLSGAALADLYYLERALAGGCA